MADSQKKKHHSKVPGERGHGRSRRRWRKFRNRPAAPEQHREIVADPEAVRTSIRIMAYGPDRVEQWQTAVPEDIAEIRSEYDVTWVDVTGLADVGLIKRLGAVMDLHPLTLEDITRPHQRPKLEEYEDHLFLVVRMAPMPGQDHTEQLSLCVWNNCVLTVQEQPGDVFDGVRNRVRQQRGRIRAAGADYLMYAILDAAIDAYFPMVEVYGDQLEELEDRLIAGGAGDMLAEIYRARRALVTSRRALWPLREMVGSLYSGDKGLVSPDTRIYLRDCYDHTIQLLDLLETYRELTSNLMDVYLSSQSNRLNEVMKVLTVITVIFIPLTFIVGVYGMNFSREAGQWNMPELYHPYGYPLCLAAMAAIALGLVIFFRRKGWIGKAK